MKQIKFRAWDRKAKTMRTVDDLHNLWTLNNHGVDVKTIPNVIVINQSYAGNDLELVVDKDCDLMQYTGLKDVKDREIYEGDVIKMKYGDKLINVEIKLRHGCFILDFKFMTDHDELCYWLNEMVEPEIIGNVHENPELLK